MSIHSTKISRLLKKYPDRIPIIVHIDTRFLIDINEKLKFLAPSNSTLSEFLNIIREKIKINKYQGLFIFIDNQLPNLSYTLNHLYNLHQQDLILHIHIKPENTFG